MVSRANSVFTSEVAESNPNNSDGQENLNKHKPGFIENDRGFVVINISNPFEFAQSLSWLSRVAKRASNPAQSLSVP
jgi:hypothetical protein